MQKGIQTVITDLYRISSGMTVWSTKLWLTLNTVLNLSSFLLRMCQIH